MADENLHEEEKGSGWFMLAECRNCAHEVSVQFPTWVDERVKKVNRAILRAFGLGTVFGAVGGAIVAVLATMLI